MTPGPGDECTWGAPSGHPNDPRTELDIELDSDGLEELDHDELLTYARQCDEQRAELLAAAKALTQTFIDGSHYKTTNPYLRPQVKAALIAIAKAEGKSTFGFDWCDAMQGYAG